MTLRLLHTADWHLGHALYGLERTWEHERLLGWLLDVVEREAVDALVIAGDVFDGANPPTEAQALWNRFLVDAWRRSSDLQVVVIGGNHDSAARLDAVDPFLRALGRLHVLGGVTRRDGRPDLERLVVPLTGRDGATAAWMAAVPFLRASETGSGTEEAVADGTRRFFDAALQLARSRCGPGQALLAAGHLYLVGTQVSSLSERQLVVGGQGALAHDLFPADVAYAALGHLHLAQCVGGREHVRYAGSLLPLALPERDYAHGVVLVELEGTRATAIRPVPAPRLVAIERIPARPAAARVEEVLAAIAALPPRGTGPEQARPFLEVCVELEHPEPGLRQRIEAALDGKEARLVRLGTETRGGGSPLGDLTARRVAELAPEEVFRLKYEQQFAAAPSQDLLAAFHELLDGVMQEQA